MKIAKKLLAVLLVAMMVMALGATAFAATATSTLTVNAVAGHTYKVYQMLTGDVSGLTNGSGTLAMANLALGSNNSAADVTTFDNALREGGVATGARLTDDALATAAEAYVTGDPVVSLNTTTNSATVTNGYYVVVDSWTSGAVDGDALSRYCVAVVGDTTISPKTATPSIDKDIVDTDANAALDSYKKTDTAAIGDTINFEIDGTVPDTTGYTYYYYVVSDTMSEGLTLDPTSFEVTVGGVKQTLNTNYYVYVTNDQTFKIAFENMKGYTADAAIVITYSAVVNENAEIGTDPNTNTAKLIYSNDPSQSARHDETNTPDEPTNPDDHPNYPDTPTNPDHPDNPGEPGVPGTGSVTGKTPDITTKTYVTELTIQKTNGTEFVDELKGATFTLTGTGLNEVLLTTKTVFEVDATDGTYYKLNDGTYTETAPTEETASSYASTTTKYKTVTSVDLTTSDSGSELNITAVVTDTGAITFTGLNVGSYKLSETNTPTGYTTAADIEFEIKAEESGATAAAGGTITWSSTNDAVQLDSTKTGTFKTTVENIKGNLLPSTGGMGTTIFYVVGTILVCGAGILLVSKKRMTKVTEK